MLQRSHLIIIGFANAYDEILRSSYPNNKLTSSYIKDIHTLIFDEALKVCPDKVDRPVGAYRKDERYIKGVDIKLSNPMAISNDLENLSYTLYLVVNLFNFMIFIINHNLLFSGIT
mgnify:CR=1 FL=1